MGRWAQRKRAGGSPTPLNYMTGAVITGGGADIIRVTFAYPVTAAAFDAASFQSAPGGAIGDSVAQVSAKVVDVTLDVSAAGDTTFSYIATLGGFNFPQVINY